MIDDVVVPLWTSEGRGQTAAQLAYLLCRLPSALLRLRQLDRSAINLLYHDGSRRFRPPEEPHAHGQEIRTRFPSDPSFPAVTSCGLPAPPLQAMTASSFPSSAVVHSHGVASLLPLLLLVLGWGSDGRTTRHTSHRPGRLLTACIPPARPRSSDGVEDWDLSIRRVPSNASRRPCSRITSSSFSSPKPLVFSCWWRRSSA